MGGPSRVSQLQYDSTMKALVKLELNSNLGSCDQPENNSHTEFRVHRTKPGDVKSAREEKVVARRRKGESSGIEDVTLVEKDGEGVVEGEETKDPIKWFGILVPQSLRRSQQCFIEGELHVFAIIYF